MGLIGENFQREFRKKRDGGKVEGCLRREQGVLTEEKMGFLRQRLESFISKLEMRKLVLNFVFEFWKQILVMSELKNQHILLNKHFSERILA